MADGFTLHENVCVHGGKRKRKLIALITDPPVIQAIMECLDLPSDPPVLAPARWPP